MTMEMASHPVRLICVHEALNHFEVGATRRRQLPVEAIKVVILFLPCVSEIFVPR
ncbi:MAG: hypothetical protein QOC61_708 [Acidobacteriota bacterium]|nr:hypothetical protein [Acidobacteriota bacterium]